MEFDLIRVYHLYPDNMAPLSKGKVNNPLDPNELKS